MDASCLLLSSCLLLLFSFLLRYSHGGDGPGAKSFFGQAFDDDKSSEKGWATTVGTLGLWHGGVLAQWSPGQSGGF